MYSRAPPHPSSIMQLLNVLLLALPLAAAAPSTFGIPGKSTSVKNSLDWKIRHNHGRKFVGTCTDQNTLSDPKYEAIVKAEYGQVTPENSMKWESTERKPPRSVIGGWVGTDGCDAQPAAETGRSMARITSSTGRAKTKSLSADTRWCGTRSSRSG